VQRLIERHRKLLALEYSAAGWKTTQMIENCIHVISDRLLQASTTYPSLRWLLHHRDIEPVFDLTRYPDLEASACSFDYLESLLYPDNPRRAVCLRLSQRAPSATARGR
jgi:hypothetical protein